MGIDFDKIITDWKKKPDPTPAPDPVPPDPVPPVPVTSEWRGVMFVPATPGMPNNHGVSSQLEYRGIHGKANENAIRIDMLKCVQAWGGNVLCYIRGEFCRPHEVLDMALNGRKHPGDGHYYPIKAPTATDGEVDWAMWAKSEYGIDKHICWIWNDNTATPITEAIVIEAVKSYDGCRLGVDNVMLGVCLEANEIMPDPKTAATALGWIEKHAPNSPTVIGSATESYLMAIGSLNPRVKLWLEQASNPVTAPLTRTTFIAYRDSLSRLAAKHGKGRVVAGEWWASTPEDVKWMTEQLQAMGFAFCGSGKYN